MKRPTPPDDQTELSFASLVPDTDGELEIPATPKGHGNIGVSEFFSDWFLSYASYVILERAVPHMSDGAKPVQRRILHSMWEMEDGRYNKVANIIGNTMKYHPHGDQSIGDALVQMGQRELLIDTQGNWGNILTGDRAAAARYIEARLSKFALEVAFNPKTTVWQMSYDGRNKEPVTLPMKFPLALAHGVEGIAVGLACKILPHNFLELIDASIDVLNGKETQILPDFATGGVADFSEYNRGLRGGRVRVRAVIERRTKNTLVITEIPFNCTTTSLIDSIISANDKGKIKVSKVEDNTAENVEILIHLPSGTDAETTIDALYVFTDCEVSVAPNTCVISEDKPQFLDVDELLRLATHQTRDLLRKELEIQLGELNEKWHFASLEKIFIENRIYRDIEEAETWEAVIVTIDKGLDPFKKLFHREITQDDIVALTEIRIKRISKYNTFKADESIKKLEEEIEQVRYDLNHLTAYAIAYFEMLRTKYGKGRERKTRIDSFSRVAAAKVAIANETLYVNRKEGFAGYAMKKDEEVCKCSDLDDIVVLRRDGTLLVSKVQPKAFMGKDIIYIAVVSKEDTENAVFNLVYRDGKDGKSYAKRFLLGGYTRDKEYPVTQGTPGSRVLYLQVLSKEKADVVNVTLKPAPRLRKTQFEFDFSSLAIKGRSAQGNVVTPHGVKTVTRKERLQIEESED
jgi:topoisomerase-4 subunit A